MQPMLALLFTGISLVLVATQLREILKITGKGDK